MLRFTNYPLRGKARKGLRSMQRGRGTSFLLNQLTSASVKPLGFNNQACIQSEGWLRLPPEHWTYRQYMRLGLLFLSHKKLFTETTDFFTPVIYPWDIYKKTSIIILVIIIDKIWGKNLYIQQ